MWGSLRLAPIRVTSKHEYYYKGHEPYEQLLHTAYTRNLDTLPLPLYILLSIIIVTYSY